MASSKAAKKAQAAWDRIEELGGGGVWEREIVAVSFDGSKINDDDLALFVDFPMVQTLDLSNTSITDKGLVHLYGLKSLETLVLIKTKVSTKAAKAFGDANPNVEVMTKPVPSHKVNPLTGL